MKFNCSSTEALVSGDPVSQPGFEATAKAEGTFHMRVKRTGQRTKQIGWVELILLDSERLAVCYADHAEFSDERSLVFPLLKGSEFGDVKRHGNSLTLHAMRVSLVLEAEPTHASDDGSSSTLVGEWARVLCRLVANETANPTGKSSHFNGLGISVHASKSAPQIPLRGDADRARPRAKHLVPPPVQPLATAPSSGPQRPQPVPRRNTTQPLQYGTQYAQAQYVPPIQYAQMPHSQMPHSQVPYSQVPHSQVPHSQSYSQYSTLNPTNYLASAPSLPLIANPGTLPTSRSFKRISLSLAETSDLNFGDDLKNVLTTLEQEEEEEEDVQVEELHALDVNGSSEAVAEPVAEPQDGLQGEQHGESRISNAKQENGDEFHLPSAPFYEGSGGESEATTPSPSSLYLQADPSSPQLDLSMGSSPKRLASILAKEQRQYVERYGSRAATLSTYMGSQPNLSPETTREPPKIPAPMPSKEAKRAKEEPAAEAMPKQATTSSKPSKQATDAVSRRRRASTSTSAKTDAARSDSAKPDAVKTGTAKTGPVKTGSAKTGPALRKSVSIANAPTVHVIREEEDLSDIESEDDEPLSKPAPGFAASTTGGSPNSAASPSGTSQRTFSSSPRTQQQKGIVKVVKKILGGKKKGKHDSTYAVSREAGDAYAREKESGSLYQASANESGSFEVLNVVKDSSDAPPSPESIEMRHHVYADLAAPESPSSPFPESSETPAVVATDAPEALETAETTEASDAADAKMASGVASATNNGGLTAAVPKLNSSSSISALSFRSLSSRSLSSKGSDTHTAETTPEKISGTTSAKRTITPPAETNSNINNKDDGLSSSPTLLKRESREELNPTPVSLEPSTSSLMLRMYENGNKSTSALQLKQPTSAVPAPHQQQPSTSSSYSSLGSRRSLHSYASSLSSASSFSTPALVKPSEIVLYTGNLWVSKWVSSRWNPLSQLEIQTDILASDSTTVKININGSPSHSLKFSEQNEIRRVGNHDIQVKTASDTYMFRGRDPENAQRFFKTLWTLQANGVQPVAAAALSSSVSYQTFRSYDEDENGLLNRRKTLLPPTLSRSNQNLKYMGRSTETIIEE